ncbi:MAG: methyltransferase domain-containing protein [Lachnospiraceae bacterium]|nr:methyltransferase domain-containing protein [Lachnospiraceae bacterium]
MDKVEYNRGNYDKYNSKNPLKRKMVEQLNAKILTAMNSFVKKLSPDSTRGKSPIRILDAGCGEGFISNMIYNNIDNVEIVGLEYTSEAINIAKQYNENIEFVQGDIYKMPFEDAAFDIVLCMEVLEHLTEPAAAIEELLRVSKNFLIITVPNEPWFCMGNLLALKNVSRLGNPIDHINHWTFGGFKKFTLNLLSSSRQRVRYDKSFPWSIAYCNKKSEVK